MRYDLNLADDRRAVAARQRRRLVAARPDGDGAARKIPKLARFTGIVQDSGEGRWTVQAAIEEAVPADVLTSALFTRFRSRQEHTFAREGALGDAREVRRPRRAGRRRMSRAREPRADRAPMPASARLGDRPRRTRSRAPVGPASIVIFGAAGDLTKRKLIPALCNLRERRTCSRRSFAIVGVGARRLDTRGVPRASVAEDMREFATHEIDADGRRATCSSALHYLARRLRRPEDVHAAREASSRELDASTARGGNHLFYLATAPEFFAPIVEHLGAAGPRRRKKAAAGAA